MTRLTETMKHVGLMDEVTWRNAKLVGQASAAAKSLKQQAMQLREAVSAFSVA